MRFFDFLKGPDINQGVKEYSTTDGAVLLDVRTPDEYRQGHIPGSKNVPLQSISKVAGMIDNKSAPIFVHCLIGNLQAIGSFRGIPDSGNEHCGL